MGVGVTAAAVTARWLLAATRSMRATARITGGSPFVHYYRGGFEPKMTRREALLILGVREGVGERGLREAHRRLMLANHPDRGGSPYLATKVNEAKDLLEGRRVGGR
jgi:DnaJ family protein C protein 19